MGQLVPAPAQQPHHLQVLVIGGQLAQATGAHRNSSYGMRVGLIGLAALPGVQHTHPGSQLRRHVEHPFPVADQPLGERTTGATAASTAQTRCGHCRTNLISASYPPRAVGNRPVAASVPCWSTTSIVTEALCGSTPMLIRRIIVLLVPHTYMVARTGTAT